MLSLEIHGNVGDLMLGFIIGFLFLRINGWLRQQIRWWRI